MGSFHKVAAINMSKEEALLQAGTAILIPRSGDRRIVMADENTHPHEAPEVRTALDATDSKELQRNPGNEDAKLDVALDETFPGSDAPSNTQPGKGKDPAPSSGYDPEAEARMEAGE
jgi:hypothetical protein